MSVGPTPEPNAGRTSAPIAVPCGPVLLEVIAEAPLAPIVERLRLPALQSGGLRWNVKLGVAHSQTPAAVASPSPWPVQREDPTCVRITTPFVEGDVWLARQSAELVVPQSCVRGTDLARRVYSALRLVFLLATKELGGLALHGCAVVSEGAAVVLLGASRAGKTTFVRHHRALELLADDLVVITGLSGQLTQSPMVWGHPFSGREGLPPTASRARLGWFGTLEQGAMTRVFPLRAGEATAAALRHTFVLQGGSEPRQYALDRCVALAQSAAANRVIWSLVPSPLLPILETGAIEGETRIDTA